MSELAVTYVSIIPETSKVAPGIKSAIGDAQKGADSAESRGRGLGSSLATGLKRATAAGLAGGALFAGVSMKKGLDRLLQIDDARASLSGLGHNVRGIDKIMSNALDSVRGTAFGLGDAGGVAASAVAAGIKPGAELTRTLKLTADAATIAKTDMGSMGAIFNKVASSNKIQGDTIAQLNDAGIPIVQLMAKELGTTAEETVKLASEGKINFGVFQNAMEEGLGGAALKSGDTARGALANVGAAMSRIGAGLLGGTFPHLAPAFQGITKALEPLEANSEKVGDKIGKVLGPALERIGPTITKVIAWLGSIDFASMGDGSSQMGRAFQDIGDSLAGIDFGSVREAFGQGAADTVSVFSVVIGFLADHIDKLAKALPFLIAGLIAYKSVQALNNIISLAGIPIQGAMALALFTSASANRKLAAQMAITNNVERVGMVQRARATVGLVAHRIATLAQAAATKTAAFAQRLLNLAMRANPLGLIITGITALVAGIIYLFSRTETGKRLWATAWGAIKGAMAATWDFIGPILSSIGNWLGKVLPTAMGFLKTVVGVAFQAIGTYVKVWWSIAKGIFTAVKWYITSVLAPVFRWLWTNIIKPVFGWIGQRVQNVWNNLIKPAFSSLRSGVSKIGDAFGSARAAIGRAWGKLGDVVRGPIDKAKNVIGGFIKLINSIPGVPDIPNPFGGKAAKETGSDRARAARGGFAQGGYTGPGPKYRAAGVVHADEFVISKRARRAFEQRNPGVLDFINRTGEMPLHGAYAAGGRVVPGRGNRHSGYGWATYAGDFPNPTGTPVKAWKDGVIALVRSMAGSYGKHMRMNHTDGTSSLYAHLSSFAKSVGDRVRQGQMIGRVGSTGNSTGPHLHLELMGGPYKGGGGGGSIWDTLKGAGGKISDWIKSKLVDNGEIGGLLGNVSGLFSHIGSGVKAHVMDNLFDDGGIAQGRGVMVKDTIAPERVLPPSSTKALDEGLRNLGAGQQMHMVSGTLSIDESGQAWIEGIAEDVVDQHEGHNAQLARMGR